MRDSTAVLDVLRSWKFVPQDDGTSFDLSFGETYQDRMVRVELSDTDVTIRLMLGNEVPVWSVRLTNAPFALFRGALELAVAEAELKSEAVLVTVIPR